MKQTAIPGISKPGPARQYLNAAARQKAYRLRRKKKTLQVTLLPNDLDYIRQYSATSGKTISLLFIEFIENLRQKT